jgi:hypothetical protein
MKECIGPCQYDFCCGLPGYGIKQLVLGFSKEPLGGFVGFPAT